MYEIFTYGRFEVEPANAAGRRAIGERASAWVRHHLTPDRYLLDLLRVASEAYARRLRRARAPDGAASDPG